MNVDSSRPECANTGHSTSDWRTLQIDLKATFRLSVDQRLENAPKRPLRSAGEVLSGKPLLHLHHVVRPPALIVELDASAIEAKGDEEVAAVGGLDPV